MPFWLHKSRLMLRVSRFSLWQKLVAGIVLVAFMGLIGLYGCFFPYLARRNRIRKNLETLSHQKVLFQQGAIRSEQSFKLNEALNQQIKELSSKSYTPQKTMNNLLEMMQRHGISCRSIKPQAVTPKNFYEKHHILIGGRAAFGKILGFLRELAASNIVVTCKTLLLRKDSYRDLKFQLMVRAIRIKDV